MFSPGQIRCLAFDAVGTVMHPHPSAAEVYHALARKFGSQIAADEVARRFRHAFRDSEGDDGAAPAESRFVTSEQIEFDRWKRIVGQVLDDVTDIDGCFQELFVHFGRPTSWRCFPETAEVLAEFKQRGYELALASNFDRRLHAVCEGHEELQQFSLRIVSSEVGCRKPGRLFYDSMVEQAQCRPDEILMIGDDLENDVIGAQSAGLHAIFVNRRHAPASGEIGTLAELLTLLP